MSDEIPAALLDHHGISLQAYANLHVDLADLSEPELLWHLFRHGISEGRALGTDPLGVVNIERVVPLGIGMLVYGWSDQDFSSALVLRQRGVESAVELLDAGVLRFWRNDVANHFGVPERTYKHGFVAVFHFPNASGKREPIGLAIKNRVVRLEEHQQQPHTNGVLGMLDLYRYLQSMMVYDELLAVLADCPAFIKTVAKVHADSMAKIPVERMYSTKRQDRPLLSVCAVVLGNPAQLKAWAIHISSHSSFKNSEINILCNGATEYPRVASVCRWLAEVMGMNVQLHLSAENLGFNHAMNRLVRASTGKYVFCTNTDVRYTNFDTNRLFKLADRGNICIARQFNSMGALQHLALEIFPEKRFVHGKSFDSIGSRLIGRNTYAAPGGDFDREVDFFGAAAFLGSASLLRSLGPFDPGMVYAYHEDTDLAIRAKRNGASMVVTSAMDVVHYESSASQVDVPKSFMIAFNTTRVSNMLS